MPHPQTADPMWATDMRADLRREILANLEAGIRSQNLTPSTPVESVSPSKPSATKPILCLDFDGVLHAYTSGWQGVSVVADGPVPGAMRFLYRAVDEFDVHVHSSRSHEEAGRLAIRSAIKAWLYAEFPDPVADKVYTAIQFPDRKPPALVTLDDRAVTFTGTFPEPTDLLTFKPWNKR